MGDRHVARSLLTHTDIYALSGFTPMIPVFKQVKTVHALGCPATVIGVWCFTEKKIFVLVYTEANNIS
jgi:hypothetical protein